MTCRRDTEMTKCGWQMFAGSSLILHFVQRCKLQGDLFKQLTGNVFIMVVKEDDDFYAGIPEGDSALLCSLHSWAACWKLGERGQQNSGCQYLAGPGSQEGRGFKGRKVTGSHQGHHPSELEDPPILCQPVSLPLLQYLQRRGPRLPGMPASLRPGEQVAGLT